MERLLAATVAKLAWVTGSVPSICMLIMAGFSLAAAIA